MRILIVGGGGREHALAWRLAQSPSVTSVIASPGNPGIPQRAKRPDTVEGFADLAELHDVDLTVVGPEAPLVDGIVDVFVRRQLTILGPTRAAARLEGSKLFAKEFFSRAGIPTARSGSDIADFSLPVVIKADGLAAGKGVVIAQTRQEANEAITRFGGNVVIEEFLEGEEVSFIGLSNGRDIYPFPATQDHKRLQENDRGPNTGGMGAYVDGRILTESQTSDVMNTIMLPAISQMAREGTPFVGFLYAGLMMTADGPKVLEFNVRLGDPEAQVLMHSFSGDLAEPLASAARGESVHWKLPPPKPTVCVVLADGRYPDAYTPGIPIAGVLDAPATVFHAATELQNGKLVTSGGRVLGVTASGNTLPEAQENAYNAVNQIEFAGMRYRNDIAAKGLRRW